MIRSSGQSRAPAHWRTFMRHGFNSDPFLDANVNFLNRTKLTLKCLLSVINAAVP